MTPFSSVTRAPNKSPAPDGGPVRPISRPRPPATPGHLAALDGPQSRREGPIWRSTRQSVTRPPACLCQTGGVPVRLCDNCQNRPVRREWSFPDGSRIFDCGDCGRPIDLSGQATVRYLESGDIAASLPTVSAQPEWATVAQVAERHGYKPKTIRADIRAGRLVAHDGPPRPYRVHRDDEQAWAEQRRTGARRSRTAPRGPRPRGSASTFRDLERGER